MAFECRDASKGGCSGNMRATGHGLYCTGHYNLRAAEWGMFPVTDGREVLMATAIAKAQRRE